MVSCPKYLLYQKVDVKLNKLLKSRVIEDIVKLLVRLIVKLLLDKRVCVVLGLLIGKLLVRGLCLRRLARLCLVWAEIA
jgi:hypothetical protein